MKLQQYFKKIYTKEYFILLGVQFIPLLWKILEIAFLAEFDNSLKILGQLALISIIFKVFEETLLNPLFKILEKRNDQQDKNINIAKKLFLYYVVATILYTSIIYALNVPIMKASRVPDYIFTETINFLKIYIVSCGFGVISKYLYTFSVINKNTKKMFTYLLIKALSTILLFVLFVPRFSFGLGVNGIAISELIINALTMLYLFLSLSKSNGAKTHLDKKQYLKLMCFAFAETLIRNIVYYCVILVFLNMIDTQDLYFVSNEYIWSILLVPALAQSTLIKQDIANNKEFSLKPYFLNCIFLVLFMVLLLPMSLLIFKNVYSLANYMDYFMVLLKLFPCYVIFVVDSVVEAYFVAIGQLNHILIQNLLTNIGVYLTAFLLYLFDIWEVSLNSIILLFNFC